MLPPIIAFLTFALNSLSIASNPSPLRYSTGRHAWIDEQKQQTKNDARHRLYRAPIFAQNVQANVPLRVQVWMVDFLVAQNLRRSRVRIRDLERKRKRAASPIVFARFNFDPKVHQVALPVRKLDRHPFFEFQFGQIWKKKKNRRQKILGERRRVVVIYLSPTESSLGFSLGVPESSSEDAFAAFARFPASSACFFFWIILTNVVVS